MDDGEPEDWPESVGTRSLDELLRCPICRGLLRLPMRSHSCAHSFCADCLRRWLAEHAGGPSCCPSCRTKGEAADWTMDGVLRGVVDAFRTARPALLAACTPGPGAAPASVQPPPRPALRSSSRAARAQGPPPVVVLSGSEAEEGEYAEEGEDPGEGSSSDDDAEFAPCKTAPPPPPRRAPATAPAAPAARAPPSGCDLCPLCGKAVPSPLLASHANACLDAASAPAERRQAAAHRPAAAGEKPPQLVMSILTTKALHSYAEQWGLIPPGADGKKAARNRKLLEERWKAFSVQAAVARDAAGPDDRPDYAAAARRTLQAEKSRSGASGGGSGGLFSASKDAHRAAAPAAAAACGDAPAAAAGAGTTAGVPAGEPGFSALIADLAARGFKRPAKPRELEELLEEGAEAADGERERGEGGEAVGDEAAQKKAPPSSGDGTGEHKRRKGGRSSSL